MKISIISHRGFWENPNEQNSVMAFEKAVESGFGIETDLRWENGKIVISHDLPTSSCLELEEFFKIWKCNKNANAILALNVKEDGLQKVIKEEIRKNKINNYFFFDMSVPDMIAYKKYELNFFTRISEYENVPILLKYAEGIWMDCFNDDDWFDFVDFDKYTEAGKQICFVSPELHGRVYNYFWGKVKKYLASSKTKILLCTDYPIEARSFFYE